VTWGDILARLVRAIDAIDDHEFDFAISILLGLEDEIRALIGGTR
jgi:hypothetical protein